MAKNKNPELRQVTQKVALNHVYANASDLIKELQELIVTHGDGGIRLDVYDDYGSPSADLTFSWQRPENTEEAKSRKLGWARQEEWDREQLKRLKEKYEKHGK